MSTRCHIATYWSQDDRITDWEALLYRHSDGYPGTPLGDDPVGVLPDIMPMLELFEARRGLDDAEYLAAWLMWHLVEAHRQGIARRASDIKHLPGDGIEGTGFGVSAEIHADIEFFYAISPSQVDVYGTPSPNPEQWLHLGTVDVQAANRELATTPA